jgi:hypothetical protein
LVRCLFLIVAFNLSAVFDTAASLTPAVAILKNTVVYQTTARVLNKPLKKTPLPADDVQQAMAQHHANFLRNPWHSIC